MKKILFFVAVVCLMTSCDSRPYSPSKYEDVDVHGFAVKEVAVRGEKHEYLLYDEPYLGGIEHLPNCKYCSTSNDSINER